MIRRSSQLEEGRAAGPVMWSGAGLIRGSAPRWPNASSPVAGVAVRSAARLHQHRPRLDAGLRTDASAPRTSGPQGRVDSRAGRCLSVLRGAPRIWKSGKAAQGPTQYPDPPMPIILSATVRNHRTIPPGLPLGGSCRTSQSFSFAGLHAARTIPPARHPRSAVCHCLPGAVGLD